MASRSDITHGLAGAWTLTGRDRELGALVDAAHGAGRGAVLLGDAGVGKTRLARELGAHVRDRGWPVEWVAADEHLGGVPYGAFAHLVRGGAGAASSLAVWRAAEHELSQRRADAGADRLLLVVDDAHFLDDASKALVHHLTRVDGVVVVVTARQPAPGATWVTSLWKDGRLDRIALYPLGQEPVRELVEAALGGTVLRPALELLWEVTRGNPLFLREVLLDAVEHDTLRRDAGVWHLRDHRLHPGARVAELVTARLGRLTSAEGRVVDCVAVGGAVGAAVVDAIAGSEVVAGLEARGILVAETSGRRVNVRLSHPLHGETWRERLPHVRLAANARRLAEGFERWGARRGDDVMRVALWRSEAGGGDPALLLSAARQIHAAADVAVRGAVGIDDGVPPPGATSRSMRLARRLAQASLDAGGGFDAALTVLVSDNLLGDAAAASASAEVARSLAPDDMARAAVAAHAALAAFLASADAARAEQALADALATTTDAAAQRALRLNRARLRVMATTDADALAAVDDVLADGDLDTPSRGEALAFKAFTAGAQGRCEEALALSARAIEIVAPLPPVGLSVGVAEVVTNKVPILAWAGRLDEMTALLDELEPSVSVATAGQRAHLHWWRGEGAALAGRAHDAAAQFSQATVLFGADDLFRIRGWACAGLAYARALVGDVDGADEMLHEMRRAPIPLAFLQWYATRAEAWRDVAAGAASTAAGRLIDAASAEGAAGRLPAAALLVLDAARLGRPDAAVPFLRQLQGRGYDGAWLEAMIRFSEGSASGEGRALDDACRQFEALGCVVWAAEAAVAASSAHRSASLPARAQAASARAGALRSGFQAVRTPLLLQAAEPQGLTQREREIARLAAAGLSDRAIADRLVVSVRTVQTHLHNIYGKLGAAGRRELATILGGTAVD